MDYSRRKTIMLALAACVKRFCHCGPALGRGLSKLSETIKPSQ